MTAPTKARQEKEKRRPGRPRNEGLALRRRDDILTVATELFAESGYANTDVQEIASRLSVAKGTVYNYFESKEALFLAAVDRGMNRLNDEINEACAPAGDPVVKIVIAVKTFLRFFDENPPVIELLVQERAEFKDRKKPTYLLHRERNIKPWNDLFEELAGEGRFRPLCPDEITQTISNLLYGTIFTTYFARCGESFLSRADNILRLIYAGILSEAERQNLESYVSAI